MRSGRPGSLADTTALIGAMDEEVDALRASLADARHERVGPFDLHRGRLEGRPVVVARCGVGKVNAAALTQAILERGVGRVLFTGVAGAIDPELRVGDVVVSTDAVQYDVDVTALGYALAEVPGSGIAWSADPALIAAAVAAAAGLVGVRVRQGRVASADRFLADPEEAAALRRRFSASCVEMEGAAVAQICCAWGIPFVIVRSISDTADLAAQVDFRAFTLTAASHAKSVVEGILRSLPSA